jgi:hypothetical protein
MEWLRHAPPRRPAARRRTKAAPRCPCCAAPPAQPDRPHPACASRCRACWPPSGATSTRRHCLPTSASAAPVAGQRAGAAVHSSGAAGHARDQGPGRLFQLLFEPDDLPWLKRSTTPRCARAGSCWPRPTARWRAPPADAITILVSAVHASGYSPALRQRMDRTAAGRALPPAHPAQRCAALLDERQADALQEAACCAPCWTPAAVPPPA